MTEKINKQEQAKRQRGLWIGLAAGLVLVVGLITLSGCSNSGASNASNGASNVNTSTSPGKIYKVDELAEAALADKDAWTGKEVTVTGYAFSYSDPGEETIPGYRITLKNDKESVTTSKNGVFCKVPQGNMPEELLNKTLEFKGKIQNVESGDLRWVTLDPCEIKK